MAINPLFGAGPATIAGAGSSPRIGGDFGSLLQRGTKPPALRSEMSPLLAAPQAQLPSPSQATAAAGKCRVDAPAGAKPGALQVSAAKVLEQVSAAQQRMEGVLRLAESGKRFSPAELLSLQANIYRASQELDLAGKVVEKATGGIKQVLQTQV